MGWHVHKEVMRVSLHKSENKRCYLSQMITKALQQFSLLTGNAVPTWYPSSAELDIVHTPGNIQDVEWFIISFGKSVQVGMNGHAMSTNG